MHLCDFFLPQNIRSALVSTILPAASTCSLLSAKVSFRRGDNDSTKLDDQWLKICNKRDECDQAIKKIQGLAFFFSAISTIESRVEKDNIERELDEEDEEQKKKSKSVIYWPAISYWIAVQSPNGTRVSTVPVHSVLLGTEMEVKAKVLLECNKGKSTIEEVLLQPIWNNAYILKNGKSIFDQKLYNLGLVRLVDIISEEGRLLTYDNMKETLSNLSGTDYFQLISIFYSLPSEWKRMIANTTNALNISVRKKTLGV